MIYYYIFIHLLQALDSLKTLEKCNCVPVQSKKEEHETADGRISVAVIERCACEANDSQKCSSNDSVESYTNSTRCGKHNLA